METQGGTPVAGNASLSAASANAELRSSPIPKVLIPPAVRLSRRSSSPVPRSSSPANRSGLRGLLPWRREHRPRSGSDPNSRDLMLRQDSPQREKASTLPVSRPGPDSPQREKANTLPVSRTRARSRSRSPAAKIAQQHRGRQGIDMHRGESHNVAAPARSRSPAVPHDHGSTSGGELLSRPRAVSAASSLSDEPIVLPEAEGGERLVTAEYSTATMSSQGSQGADSLPGDDIDGATSTDPQRVKAAIENLQHKIEKTTEQIKQEQKARDEHVSEYLKLAANADRQQAARIKSVFEKKNQKSATNIQQLQRKLENYQRRLKEAQENGVVAHRQPKEVLRDMGQGLRDVGANIRDGITGFSGAVVNKPKEFAHLIKNKFGSADNISSLNSLDEREDLSRQFLTPSNISTISSASHPTSQPSSHHGYGSEDECSSMTSGSGGHMAMPSPEIQPGPSSQSIPAQVLQPILEELQEMRNNQALFQNSMADLKNQMQQEYSFLTTALQEERYRYELQMKNLGDIQQYRMPRVNRLEEQLNDLTELHQNEMSNLKQELASMEEKVAYQSDERARDIQEALESCQTRISKMELAQQQQQLVSMEGLDSANARALISKLINVLLAVIAVILVLVSTLAGMVTPMLKTRSRVASSLLALLVTILLWRNWGNVVDAYHHFLEHYAVMVTLR
ncbi:transmembrane and coiled-coil domain protein 3-like isoform X7 [Branchiostoma floridae]|uniref:Transmembrane and coiled-coil domain protein 3-like isoform X7 n=1 Tax=Branchiostoma floridae TaxID=7739 RepID=A0A9J7KEV2_BRAFL|nr:transmembrane and coiled-coil domain protein 3-like isoform X7 [Branchiostoma floridae]